MKNFIKKSLNLSLMALMLVTATAHKVQAETIDDIQKRKVIRVGFASFVPWAMQNKKGEYIGFEIDVAKRLAKDLGFRYEPVPTAWAGIIPALLTNKIDVIIGGMGITEVRKEQIDFSNEYDKSERVLLASLKSASNLKSIKDFDKKEIIIVIRLGAPTDVIKENFPNATVRQFNDEAACIEELIAGRAHGMVATDVHAGLTIARKPNTLFVPFSLGMGEPIGFGVQKNNPQTIKVFNEWIAKVENEGWLQERRDYWFKSIDWEKDL